MLIDGTYAIINQIIFNLNFDNTNKSVVMKKDDIVGITYKKDGEKLYIKGRLDEIRTVPNPNTNNSVVYIKIDGSEEYVGRVAVVTPENVLDIILFETTGTIINPVLSVNDLSKRIILLMENEDGQLLYSKDGISWGTPARGLQGISAYEVAVENGYTGTEEEWLASLKGDKGIDGIDGKSAYQIAVDDGFVGTEEEWLASLKGDKGIDGISGTDGESAYQLAVDNGYTGTEVEWLESLKGEKGADGIIGVDGKSAYQIAVDDGFVGTEAEWLESLKGKDGTNGIDGKSAYEVAVENGFTGTEVEWLESLKGENGDEGPKGDDGSNGDPGKSAYQLAVDNGFSGTEEEWLESLKGERGPSGGEQGKSAYEVAVENGFVGTEEEWLESLKGANGTDGEDGKSAYEVAVENGYIGTEEEWLEFIKGAPGDRGQKGDQGQKGDTPYIDEDTGRWFIAGQDTGKVAVPNIIDIPEIPTALSQLENDENFIKNTVNNLINYYLKSDTYTKQEINNILGGLSTVTISVVSELPTENISTNTIYLIDIGNGVFSQHIYINGEWASFGDTSVNLENYVTQANLQAALNTKAELNHTHAELHTHPNKPVLDTITAESVTKWNNGFSGKYNDLTGTPDIPTVTNDLTDELKTSYDQAVDEMHTHVNKPVLDKFTESVTGNVLYDGKEISTGGSGGTSIDDETISLSKTWSSQKISSEVDTVRAIANDINIAQKMINSNLGHAQAYLTTSYTPVVNAYVPFNSITGNINVTDGKFYIKSGKTYEITIILGYINTAQTVYSNVLYGLYINKNTKIASLIPQYGQPKYELPFVCNTIYTNKTDTDQECGLITEAIYTNSKLDNGTCTMSIKEIGKDIVIDPVNYINTTQGIEDIPVGNVIDIIGETIPKHYLYCNGAVYNIADYLHLAEYIKKEFGIYNYFGGDGTTTFAVPNLVNGNPLVDITPTMTSNTTPSPYVVTGSAPYYADNPAYLAFNNGATASSFLTVPSGWVQLDFVSNQKISHFLLQAPNSGDMTIMPKDFTLYGSNDGSSYVELKSYSNQSKWLLNEKRVYDLEDVYNYRYYKFKIINNNGSATYSAINEIRFLLKEVEKVVCIKYEPTYFMNIQGLVETNILWDGNVGTTGTTVVKNSINLNDSILNYDKIGVHFATTDSKGEVRPQYNEITQFEWNKLKTAPNSQTSLSFVWGYGSFADYTTFEITSTDTRLDISQTQSCIYRVDGIRYKTFQTN